MLGRAASARKSNVPWNLEQDVGRGREHSVTVRTGYLWRTGSASKHACYRRTAGELADPRTEYEYRMARGVLNEESGESGLTPAFPPDAPELHGLRRPMDVPHQRHKCGAAVQAASHHDGIAGPALRRVEPHRPEGVSRGTRRSITPMHSLRL